MLNLFEKFDWKRNFQPAMLNVPRRTDQLLMLGQLAHREMEAKSQKWNWRETAAGVYPAVGIAVWNWIFVDEFGVQFNYSVLIGVLVIGFTWFLLIRKGKVSFAAWASGVIAFAVFAFLLSSYLLSFKR